jgi:hypothetical protein
MTLEHLVPILTTAIGPVILISGVGLLLLSMTNRLGRIIDRAHSLARRLQSERVIDRRVIDAQLEVLRRRGSVMRLSILYAVLSVLCAATLVISLFVAVLVQRDAGFLVVALFVACMGLLIVSLVAFLRDVYLSLDAVTLEMQGVRGNISDPPEQQNRSGVPGQDWP